MDFPKKTYVDAQKFRAVLWRYFSPAARVEFERNEMIAAGMNRADAEIFFPEPGSEYTDEQLVQASVDWTFSEQRNVAPGRFNDSSFAALYTAKELTTAVAELSYWNGIGHEYVIYEVGFSGDLLDLRPAIDSGLFRLSISHSDCQPIGALARLNQDGLAAYSVRLRGGNSCVIFSRSNVVPLGIADRGVL